MQRLKIYIIWANRWTSKEWWKILGCSSLRSCARGETADYRPYPGVWKPCVQHYDNLLVTGYEVLMDVTMYIYACVFVYLYIHLGELFTSTSTRYMKETWKITMSIVIFLVLGREHFLRSWTGIRTMRVNKGRKAGHKWGEGWGTGGKWGAEGYGKKRVSYDSS